MARTPEAKALSLERRRKRNREAMQRLRERQQLAIEQLRLTARDLEATLSDMLQRLDLSAPFTTLPLPSTRLDETQQHAQSLLQRNEQLQQRIDDYIKWEDRVSLLVDDASTNGAETKPPPVDYDFVPPPRLSDSRAAELMLLHHRYRAAVEKKWRSTTLPPFTSQFFGWDIQYFFEGDYWHHRFSKLVRNASSHAISERAWRNAQQLISYRSRLPRQRIVQHINDDTFVFARWGSFQQRLHRVAYHLRFRLEEPDGSIGIAMQTLPSYADDTEHARDQEGDDVCLYIKFTPVRDVGEQDGVEHCVVEYSGRIHFGDDEQLNALELVISLARWEEVNVAQSPVPMVWS